MSSLVPSFSRRRFMGITAASAALGWLPATLAEVADPRLLVEWRGFALGAAATIRLHHPDPDAARALIADGVAEIARLERVFSLFQPDSALSRLNRDRVLTAPPQPLVELLADAAGFSRLTGGAFDATVQPLWRLYADHFGRADADPDGPAPEAVRRARELVDWRGVEIASDRIALARPGMAVTLNGIAQGYITDRVIARLQAAGMTRVLADLGETRALGRHPAGRPWSVGLEDPRRPGHIARTLEISDGAVATSGGYGTRFEPSGRFHHLFDPATGGCPGHLLAVSVQAPTATAADALATACVVLPEAAARRLLAGQAGTVGWFTPA
jgi:thiamine biosynthesis lipoprotein